MHLYYLFVEINTLVQLIVEMSIDLKTMYLPKKRQVKEFEFKTVVFNMDNSKDKYVNVTFL